MQISYDWGAREFLLETRVDPGLQKHKCWFIMTLKFLKFGLRMGKFVYISGGKSKQRVNFSLFSNTIWKTFRNFAENVFKFGLFSGWSHSRTYLYMNMRYWGYAAKMAGKMGLIYNPQKGLELLLFPLCLISVINTIFRTC